MIKILQKLVDKAWEDVPLFRIGDKRFDFWLINITLKRWQIWIILFILVTVVILKFLMKLKYVSF